MAIELDVDIYVSAPTEAGAHVMIGDPERLTGDPLLAASEAVCAEHLEAAGWTADGRAGLDRYIAYRAQLGSLLDSGKIVR